MFVVIYVILKDGKSTARQKIELQPLEEATYMTSTEQTAFRILMLGDVDFEQQVISTLRHHLDSVSTMLARTEKEYTDILAKQLPELILLDLEAKEPKPFKFLSMIFKGDTQYKVVALVNKPDVESIVKCTKLGVNEFVQMPEEAHKLRDYVKKQLAEWQKQQASLEMNENQGERYRLENIIADSPEMRHVVYVTKKVFNRPWVTVLVRGETGTGKEVIARGIHYGTPETKSKPFVEVNCTAIPETLLESELFVHEKGAVTDAKYSKKGLFEMANGGTLFLDEIGDMNHKIQAKLLKAIEEKRFRRLGGTDDIQVKLRIIAGTNADLEQKVQTGEFRTDLFYRLNVINIFLPPLQERGEDIIALANYFLRRYISTYGISERHLSDGAKSILANYDWPGNVRELQHVIERVVVLGESAIIDSNEINTALGPNGPQQLPSVKPKNGWRRVIEIPRDGLSLKEGEMKLISEVLRITKGNKTQACKILGISRPRLNRKLDEYEISPDSVLAG